MASLLPGETVLQVSHQPRAQAAAVISLLLTVWIPAYGQSYDWERQRELDAAERTARAAERQADAAERAADATRRRGIEQCFERGERARCLAMMTPFEQNQFSAMEGARMAGRGLGEAIRGAVGGRSPHEEAVARLRALHPDYQEIVADPAFRRWVNASPTRREMMAKAHAEYDVDAADMLFNAWKQLREK